MKRIFYIFVLTLLSISVFSQDKICLPTGTRVSVKITHKMSSQHWQNPTTVVAADVYDSDGEYILIRRGTPVEVQTQIQRAAFFGEEGAITFLPISTTAVDGREIVFQDYAVSFEGNDALLRNRKKVKIAAGTAFAAYTANTYCFKIEKLEKIHNVE